MAHSIADTDNLTQIVTMGDTRRTARDFCLKSRTFLPVFLSSVASLGWAGSPSPQECLQSNIQNHPKTSLLPYGQATDLSTVGVPQTTKTVSSQSEPLTPRPLFATWRNTAPFLP